MKTFAGFTMLASALALAACASSLPKPEQYGFQRVAIKGQDYFCAPSKWVVPPVTPAVLAPAVAAGGVLGIEYPQMHEVCITQAQWPQWLTLRNRLDGEWPITPSAAMALASH